METKELYVLTPEPIEVLNKVNILCKGMLNIPLEMFYEQNLETPSPYVTYSEHMNINRGQKGDLGAIAKSTLQRKYLIHQNQPQQPDQQADKQQQEQSIEMNEDQEDQIE